MRLFLNNAPLFHYGLLDQGFWPDGLYTAPTDEALRYDLEVTKQLGFNMVRKHVKIEPRRWYTWADRLGLLVWQDMPSGGQHAGRDAGEIVRSPAAAAQFEQELKRMVDVHRNHPSIVMWVLFNEGWGQYDTTRLTEWLKGYDPGRLVDSASGWNDLGVGDVHDIHAYPGPSAPETDDGRAAVLGEFGGLGLPIPGLTWQNQANWSYRGFDDAVALMDAYSEQLEELRELITREGLAAAVYTQTTDVEIEVNGMMTYDRSLIKMDAVNAKWAARKLYWPAPVTRTLVPTSEQQGISWRFTTEQPALSWQQPGFDDSTWQEAPGGFGRPDSPGAVVRTEWTAPEIWLRHTFDFEDTFLENPYLRLHHDEDMNVYLNGELIAKLPFYTTRYVEVDLDERARSAIRPGANVLAIHCKKLAFGQYCDAGLYDRIEQVANGE